MGSAVAYLRRSRVDTAKPGDLSYEQQLSAVRRLAEAHGDDPAQLVILEDWGKSGRAAKQGGREAFASLEAMINDGSARAVYAYSISRLARSVEVLSALAKLCERQGVPIRCAVGHSPDVSTATGRMITSILGAIEEWQADWNVERMAEATAIRRARGDYIGPAPYGWKVKGGQLVANPTEDVGAVIAAFEDAGRSYHAAARLLRERKVPTRNGKPWAATSLRSILERNAPDTLPEHPKPGPRAGVTATLAGLLRCPCGATLTARLLRRPGGDRFAYECRRSYDDPAHAHPRTVVESQIIDWIRAEAARFRPPFDRVAIGDEDAMQRRADLEEKRRRVIEDYEELKTDKAERDSKLLAISNELERLSTVGRVEVLPAFDSSWTSEGQNAWLRAVWSEVKLGPDLRPVEAVRRVPEWWAP